MVLSDLPWTSNFAYKFNSVKSTLNSALPNRRPKGRGDMSLPARIGCSQWCSSDFEESQSAWALFAFLYLVLRVAVTSGGEEVDSQILSALKARHSRRQPAFGRHRHLKDRDQIPNILLRMELPKWYPDIRRNYFVYDNG